MEICLFLIMPKELRITGVSKKTLDNIKGVADNKGVSISALVKYELKKYNQDITLPERETNNLIERRLNFPEHIYKQIQTLAKDRIGISTKECITLAIIEFIDNNSNR